MIFLDWWMLLRSQTFLLQQIGFVPLAKRLFVCYYVASHILAVMETLLQCLDGHQMKYQGLLINLRLSCLNGINTFFNLMLYGLLQMFENVLPMLFTVKEHLFVNAGGLLMALSGQSLDLEYTKDKSTMVINVFTQ